MLGANLTSPFPVKVGGTVVGALLFEKHWTRREVQRLKLVAEVLGNAFERRRAEAEIRRLSDEFHQGPK